jgi:hypothetical protein
MIVGWTGSGSNYAAAAGTLTVDGVQYSLDGTTTFPHISTTTGSTHTFSAPTSQRGMTFSRWDLFTWSSSGNWYFVKSVTSAQMSWTLPTPIDGWVARADYSSGLNIINILPDLPSFANFILLAVVVAVILSVGIYLFARRSHRRRRLFARSHRRRRR